MSPQTPTSSGLLYALRFNPSDSVFNFHSSFSCVSNHSNDYPPCGGSSGSISGMVDLHLLLSMIISRCPLVADDTIHFSCTPFNMFDDAGCDALAETLFDSMMPENDESVLCSSYLDFPKTINYCVRTINQEHFHIILFAFSSTQHQRTQHTFSFYTYKTFNWSL